MLLNLATSDKADDLMAGAKAANPNSTAMKAAAGVQKALKAYKLYNTFRDDYSKFEPQLSSFLDEQIERMLVLG